MPTIGGTLPSKSFDCPQGDVILDPQTGFVICRSTGEVLGETVDYGPEWREFPDTPSDRRRASVPHNMLNPNEGLGSYVRSWDVDALRRRGVERSRTARRLRQANIMARRVREKQRLYRSQNQLRIAAQMLNLPRRCVATANNFLKIAIKYKLGRGERIRYYIAASLFLAARMEGIPLALEEVVKRLFPNNGDRSQEARDKILVSNAMRKLREKAGGVRYKIMQPIDYVPSAASRLELGVGTEKLMLRLARAVQALDRTHGKNPRAIVAAIAYISAAVMGEKKRQKEIAEALGVFTDVAIRNRYRDILSKIHIDVAL